MRSINSIFKKSAFAAILIFALFNQSCKEDDYYARPESLEPVIYKQLEQKGNFTSFLACVDRAGYKDVLNRASYLTVFAPTNEAFQQFMQENNFSSIDAIDDETVKKIVNYSIVYNGYSKDRLDDFQSKDSASWIADVAFKRRTSYYEWVKPVEVDGDELLTVDMNAVGPEESPAGYHRAEDYNNKHIPFFTDNYLAKNNLTDFDYNYFFPNSTFNGFNIVDAQVIESDLWAENGVLHTVDKVLYPLPSIDDLIRSDPQYNEFKELLDKYLVEYNLAGSDLLNRYELATGNREDIYIKAYPSLHLAPNCENYLKYGFGEEHDAQIDGWTAFIPTNDALQEFYNTKFLEHYSSLDEMPQQIISELVNAHLFRTTVWPSKFDVTLNPFGEPARFDPGANVVERRFGSNGLFYGVNKVQETDGFYTLLGDIYLNPDYSLMLQALYTTGLYAIVKNTNLNFTVFMIPNSGFERIGLSYDETINTWFLENPFLGSNATQALNRIINMHIIVNNVIDDFEGTGYIQTYGDEFIRYDKGDLWGVGNLHNEPITYTDDKNERSNGNSFVLNDLLYYTTNNIGYDIAKTPAYSKFYEYLKRAGNQLPGFIYDLSDQSITNFSIADPNTLLIPVDTAIDGAIRDGYLPQITALPFTEEELDLVAKFVYYHSLNGHIVVPGYDLSGDVKTLYKTVDGSTYVTVNNEARNIMFFDSYGNTARAVDPDDYTISKLSNNAVIHLVDNYLRY